MKIIFHIDLNAFFVSAEELNNPGLKGKPVVISRDEKRSVVATASYAARKYGIHSGMPLYKAKELCPQLVIVKPHFDYYRELSGRFFDIIQEYTEYLQPASIDEGYADMTQYITDHQMQPYDLAKELQDRILKTLELPCSIGIAPNKYLAKMASDMKKPLGITLLTKRNLEDLLWLMDISEMHGIGKKTAPKLKELGINTIKDVANYKNYDLLHSVLGRQALLFYNFANGHDQREVKPISDDAKSIGNSMTFQEDLTSEEEIENAFSSLARSVAQRAQKHHMLGDHISITIRYSLDHQATRQMSINRFTDQYEDIYSYALILFKANYEHLPIRLLGVTLTHLIRKEHANIQMSIFDHISEDDINDLVKKYPEENS